MAHDRSDLLQGTLVELPVLKTLSPEPLHGWRPCSRVPEWSGGLA